MNGIYEGLVNFRALVTFCNQIGMRPIAVKQMDNNTFRLGCTNPNLGPILVGSLRHLL